MRGLMYLAHPAFLATGDSGSGSGMYDCDINPTDSTRIKGSFTATNLVSGLCPGGTPANNIAEDIADGLHDALAAVSDFPLDCTDIAFQCGTPMTVTVTISLDGKYTLAELGAIVADISGITEAEYDAAITAAGVAISIADEVAEELDGMSVTFENLKAAIAPVTTVAGASTTTVVGQAVPDAATDAKPVLVTAAAAVATTVLALVL